MDIVKAFLIACFDRRGRFEMRDLLSFTYDGLTIKFWLPDSETDFVQKVMMRNKNFWERKMLERVRLYFPRNGVVVDVGGFVGNHAVYFSKVCHASKVYSFEPQADIAAILEKNIQLNDVTKIVELKQIALGDRRGRMSVNRVLPGTRAGTSFKYDLWGAVEASTLDAFSFDKVDLLKVDAEGLEAPILRGGYSLLDSFSPIVWVEAASESDLLNVSRCLNYCGYALFEQISEMDFLFRKCRS